MPWDGSGPTSTMTWAENSRKRIPWGRLTIRSYVGPNLVEVETGRVGTNVGRRAQYAYNGLNQAIQVYRVDDAGIPVIWDGRALDTSGRMVFRTNAAGRVMSYTHNNVGLKVKTVDEYGATNSYAYDAWGNVTQMVNGVGVTNRMQYDYLRRLTNRIEAVGAPEQRVTGYRYNAQGDRIQITQPDGSFTYLLHDLAGRMTAASGTLQYARSNVYDGNGNVIASIDGNGNRITNTYDAYNRLVFVRYPDGAVESNVYDEVGNRIRFVDGNTNTTYFAHDDLNRLTSRSLPNDSNTLVMTYAYNAWNEITLVSNVVGGVQRSHYDEFGRMTNSIDAAGLSLVYTYDFLDQVTSTRWLNGTTASNVYDNMRLVSTLDRAGNAASNAFDAIGRQIRTVDSLGATNQIGYDALNRLTAITNALSEGTLVAYDAFNRPAQITYADGGIEYRQYDGFGKITNHYGAGQYAVMYRYDSVGNLTNLVDGNGSITTWAYDGRNLSDPQDPCGWELPRICLRWEWERQDPAESQRNNDHTGVQCAEPANVDRLSDGCRRGVGIRRDGAEKQAHRR